MKAKSVRQFLQQHQPLPDFPSEQLLDRYRTATAILYRAPDLETTKLLISSIPLVDDLSLYDAVQSVLRRFPCNQVVPIIQKGLQSSRWIDRFFAADTARYYPVPQLLDPMKRCLYDHRLDVRLAAQASLESFPKTQVEPIFRAAVKSETDAELRQVMYDYLHGPSRR